MRFRVELSKEPQKQLAGFPRDVRDRMERAIDELEEKDDSQWANLKALQGSIAWERANPPAIDPKMFDYAAEDAAFKQFTAARA